MKNILDRHEKNHKCIWMSAGVISYKLCNCQFQCESCAFDKVMLLKDTDELPDDNRQIESIPTEINDSTRSLINQYLFSYLSDLKIQLDRFYHHSHLWYKLESDTVVVVGINKLFLKILEPIQQIKLPVAGRYYEKDQPVTEILRNGSKIPITTAIAGTVIDLNENAQIENPDANSDDTYYFKMEVKNIQQEIEQFCTNICGLKYFSDLVSLLKRYLNNTFRWYHETDLGITLADGGLIQVCLEKVLGEEAYRNLLDELI